MIPRYDISLDIQSKKESMIVVPTSENHTADNIINILSKININDTSIIRIIEHGTTKATSEHISLMDPDHLIYSFCYTLRKLKIILSVLTATHLSTDSDTLFPYESGTLIKWPYIGDPSIIKKLASKAIGLAQTMHSSILSPDDANESKYVNSIRFTPEEMNLKLIPLVISTASIIASNKDKSVYDFTKNILEVVDSPLANHTILFDSNLERMSKYKSLLKEIHNRSLYDKISTHRRVVSYSEYIKRKNDLLPREIEHSSMHKYVKLKYDKMEIETLESSIFQMCTSKKERENSERILF